HEVAGVAQKLLVDLFEDAFFASGNAVPGIASEQIGCDLAGLHHRADLADLAVPRVFDDLDSRGLLERLEESGTLAAPESASERRNAKDFLLCRGRTHAQRESRNRHACHNWFPMICHVRLLLFDAAIHHITAMHPRPWLRLNGNTTRR